jgi:hypothetical protein
MASRAHASASSAVSRKMTSPGRAKKLRPPTSHAALKCAGSRLIDNQKVPAVWIDLSSPPAYWRLTGSRLRGAEIARSWKNKQARKLRRRLGLGSDRTVQTTIDDTFYVGAEAIDSFGSEDDT